MIYAESLLKANTTSITASLLQDSGKIGASPFRGRGGGSTRLNSGDMRWSDSAVLEHRPKGVNATYRGPAPRSRGRPDGGGSAKGRQPAAPDPVRRRAQRRVMRREERQCGGGRGVESDSDQPKALRVPSDVARAGG